MKTKIRICYLLIMTATLIVSMSVLGQAKYYKTLNSKTIDSLSYTKLKTNQLNRFKVSHSQVILEDELKELYRNNDSIVYSYKWNIKLGENKTLPAEGVKKYIGKTLPIKTLTTIDNKSIVLNDLKGKPTLINFWFTTCNPCVDEIAALNKIKSTFKDSVNFIAITHEKKDVVTKFLRKHNYNFIQVINAQTFLHELGLTGFPLNVFLDKEGKVVSVEGGISYEKGTAGKMKMGDGITFIKILRKLL